MEFYTVRSSDIYAMHYQQQAQQQPLGSRDGGEGDQQAGVVGGTAEQRGAEERGRARQEGAGGAGGQEPFQGLAGSHFAGCVRVPLLQTLVLTKQQEVHLPLERMIGSQVRACVCLQLCMRVCGSGERGGGGARGRPLQWRVMSCDINANLPACRPCPWLPAPPPRWALVATLPCPPPPRLPLNCSWCGATWCWPSSGASRRRGC